MRSLSYVSQDFCLYEGAGNGKGLQAGKWDTSRIDLVCDIVAIPEPDSGFDAILCSEVLEPEKNVDIGSRVDGFIAHVASFREIEVFDVRPITTQIPGVPSYPPITI